MAVPGLRTLALYTHVWFVGNAIIGVVLAPYALSELSLSPFQFGIIGAVGGIGALLGAAVTTWVGLRLGTGWTIITAHLVTVVGVLVMVDRRASPDRRGLRSRCSLSGRGSTGWRWA